MKLDPEFKAKWITALRSGKYPQGTGYLCLQGKYCCLGVGADIAGKLGPPNPSGYRRVKDVSRSCGVWFGPNDELVITDAASGKRVYDLLASFNDKGMSFNKIADWIEENL